MSNLLYNLGRLVRVVYPDDAPPHIIAAATTQPAKALGMIARELTSPGRTEPPGVAGIMNNIDPEDIDAAENGGVRIELQAKFWEGYYEPAPPQLDKDAFCAWGQALYGDTWQTTLARDLSVDPRRVRAWAKGERSIPPGVTVDMRAIAAQRSIALLSLKA